MGAKKVTFASADGASSARFYLASAPAHTHERRMEVYTYFNIPENNVVFHMMGQGKETRHLVMQNQERILKDSAYWYRETIRTNGEKLS